MKSRVSPIKGQPNFPLGTLAPLWFWLLFFFFISLETQHNDPTKIPTKTQHPTIHSILITKRKEKEKPFCFSFELLVMLICNPSCRNEVEIKYYCRTFEQPKWWWSWASHSMQLAPLYTVDSLLVVEREREREIDRSMEKLVVWFLWGELNWELNERAWVRDSEDLNGFNNH